MLMISHQKKKSLHAFPKLMPQMDSTLDFRKGVSVNWVQFRWRGGIEEGNGIERISSRG
jgi:hypothetical protein